MRRFQFRLEAVLRYRKTIEDLREQDFMTAQGMLRKVEQRIEELRADYLQTLSERPGGCAGEAFDAPGIYDRERYLEAVQAQIAQQQSVAEAARIIVEETRRELVKARQAREAVSRLREKHHTVHVALELQMEQAALDELSTLKHARAVGGIGQPTLNRPQSLADRKAA